MFTSILIANRGEIACRIIRTCRRLGIRTVAVYSDADRCARHVREADEAQRIGPAESSASYLNAHAILEAAQRAGAQAVHPGYGFLSEKITLAQMCLDAGIAWVGPRPQVIAQMGSKIESKLLAQRAGVSTVPGYHGDRSEPDYLLARAREIGWPILIKASAGGGGKGMRKVESEAQFLPMLEEARKEALRSFGDDRVLLEKLITRPRHLEVQLLGDRHGGLIHLHERECSVQRNYQKVIEEAPAAFLDAEVRLRLHENALKLGREIGYDSAGTVEFVLDEGTHEPYFLEMNTRLQVEHPVTELVTGLDLVELQIRAALGERLGLTQDQVNVSGHAIEARVNCEDAANGYRPQIGCITGYEEPALAGVRIDSGVESGSEVTPYYDSMIAKVIGFAPTREAAARQLISGLGALRIEGVGTNQRFLQDIVAHRDFHERPLTTHFLAQAFPDGWHLPQVWMEDAIAAVLFHHLCPALEAAACSGNPWGAHDGFRLVGRSAHAASTWTVKEASQEPLQLTLLRDGTHWLLGLADREPIMLQINQALDGGIVVKRDARSSRFLVSEDSGFTVVSCGGQRVPLTVLTRLEALARSAEAVTDTQGEVRANMPGLVTIVHVQPGQRVQAGDLVAVMDSMKLLYSYEAAISGEVTAVGCKIGDTVSNGQLLVEITPYTN